MILQKNMHYFKELFIKGRYSIYLAFAAITEMQRNYMLPKTKVYKHITQKVKQELAYSNPHKNYEDLTVETTSEEDKKKLKISTKKQVDQIQTVQRHRGSTTIITYSILGLGAINYFLAPTACGFFISSYLTLLSIDFLKSMVVIKYGISPMWNWKMQDVGYLMAFSAGIFTVAVLTKSGLTRLRERAQKALVLKDLPEKNKQQ